MSEEEAKKIPEHLEIMAITVEVSCTAGLALLATEVTVF